MRRLLVSALAILLPFHALAKSETLAFGDQQVELFMAREFSDSHRDSIRKWLIHGLESLQMVYGSLPRDKLIVEVDPSFSSRGPVDWGQVIRGDVDKVYFTVDPGRGTSAMIRDWTLYHELSHTLIPYRGWGDKWFSEGFASYYQNILQYRAGLLSHRQMHDKIQSGFQRGRDQNHWPETPLYYVSRDMRRNHAFMRVYWSGAWYWVEADRQLREKTGGKFSLDNLLLRLKDCCSEQKLSAMQIARRLDEFAEAKIFVPLFYKVRNSTGLPDSIEIPDAAFSGVNPKAAGD